MAGLLRGVLRRQRALASVVVLSVAAGGLAFAAIQSPGARAADLSLNDGGVWVVNNAPEGGQAGGVFRVNHALARVDASVTMSNVTDLQQIGGTVLAGSDGQYAFLDVTRMGIAGGPRVPAGSAAVLGGGAPAADGVAAEPNVAVVSRSGDVWFRSASAASALDATREHPDKGLGVGAGGSAVVGVGGAAQLFSSQRGRVLTVPRPGAAVNEVTSTALAVLKRGEDFSATAVGGVPVVLSGGRLQAAGGGVVDLDKLGHEIVLQQPGAAADSVVVATDRGLWSVPLAGGTPVLLEGVDAAEPAAPVLAGGCYHGVWSGGTRPWVEVCDGVVRGRKDVPGVVGGQLVLRENRGLVVIQGQEGGPVAIPELGMVVVNTWAVDLPKNTQAPRRKDGKDSQGLKAEPEKLTEEKPPTARPDVLGARAGRVTILPVLLNDDDPNGDTLAISSVSGEKSVTSRLQIVQGGSALQLIAPEARTELHFSYTVDDGQRSASATVEVTVKPAHGGNEKPVLRTVPGTDTPYREETTVAVGRTTQYAVVGDWVDPDGDPIRLLNASSNVPDDSVRAAPDGTITVTAAAPTGTHKITYVVADDGGLTGLPAVLSVRVIDPKELAPPTVRGDVAMTAAGRDLRLHPLDNDADPNGDTMSITRLGPVLVGGRPTTVKPILNEASGADVVFNAKTPGDYIFGYWVSDGTAATAGKEVQGQIRVRVLDPASTNSPPVPVRDIAVVPVGGAPTLVDLLANDTDLDGDVLVVTHLTVPQDLRLRLFAGVEHGQLLRISASEDLGVRTIEYTVSDGKASANGEILVQTVPPPARDQAPTALDDTAVVRAGAVVDIPVLANDRDPEGDPLRILPALQVGGGGNAVAAGDTLRYQAPQMGTVGVVTIDYTIQDSSNRSATARVKVRVRPDDQINRAPEPRDLEARVQAGGTVQISVPLDNVDPDGDALTLVGPSPQTTAGRGVPATAVGIDGAQVLTYTADKNAGGTDEFTYQLKDSRGLTGTGHVRVGVAPRVPGANQPPVVADDKVVVAPGRALRVRVMDNDNDPDGDPIQFDPFLPLRAQGAPITVKADKRDLVLSAPPASLGRDKPVTVTIPYGIRDDKGAQDQGALQVTYTAKAPGIPPVAVDDVARVGAGTSPAVLVDVLANDYDVDGTVAALRLSALPNQPAPVSVEGRRLKVIRSTGTVIVGYTVTDADGLSASAFVTVPGLTVNRAPVATPPSLTVKAGASLRLDVANLAKDPDGDRVQLTRDSDISRAALGTLIAKGPTQLVYTAGPKADGVDVVSVRVMDRPLLSDPTVATTQVILKIAVGSSNQPPTVTPGGLDVENGLAAGSTLQLSSLASDKEQDPLTFSRTSGPPWTSVTLAGLLVAKAPAGAKLGPAGTVVVAVSDGVNKPVPLPVTLTVTASHLDRAKLLPIVEPKANVGQAVTYQVLQGAWNPFPDKPLTVVAPVQALDGAPRVSNTSTSVTVTPTVVGLARVVYTVRDGSGEPGRDATGTIEMTVRDKPDPVTGLSATPEAGGGAVRLTWSEPYDGGTPITGYAVTVAGGPGAGLQQAPVGTGWVVSGLTNAITYTFTVAAVNEVGTGVPSDPTSAKPDRIPDQPTGVNLAYMAKTENQLTLTWTEPRGPNSGTPVSMREVTLSGSGTLPPPCTTPSPCVFGNLTPGATYTAQIVLTNDAGSTDPVDSSSATPYAAPGAPTITSVADQASAVNGGEIVLTFDGGTDGGDPAVAYTIAAAGTGRSWPGQPGSNTLDGLSPGSSYSFTVTARNLSMIDTTSPASSPVLTYAQPGVVTATVTAQDSQLTLDFQVTSDGGKPITGYQAYVNGAPWGNVTFSGNQAQIKGLTNGTDYTGVGIVASNGKAGKPNNVYGGHPFGLPEVPMIVNSGVSGLKVTFAWSVRGDGGSPITRTHLSGPIGPSDGSKGGETSAIYGDGGQTQTETYEVCNAAGCVSASASGRSDDRRITVFQGPKQQNTACWTSSCARVGFTLANFPPNHSEFAGFDSGPHGSFPSYCNFIGSTDVNGNGGGNSTTCSYGWPNTTVTVTYMGTSTSMTWPNN